MLRENAARAVQGLSMPPVRLQERDVLQENAAQTAQVLTMTSEEKQLLDTFLHNFFWKKEEGFCRKLPEGHGVRAVALQSTTNVVDALKSIIDIRQACLGALYPDKPSRELLLRELDTDESTVCYEFMFEKWVSDDSHWREEQEATYGNRTRGLRQEPRPFFLRH